MSSSWYGMYESHEPDEGEEWATCRIGVMQLVEPPYSEDNHDVSHNCSLDDGHKEPHKCYCEEEF